jgi:hypothetical protein
MPWELATPLKVGDLDPAGDITHVRVGLQRNDPDRKMILLSIEYGRMVDNSFETCALHPIDKEQNYAILDDEWVDLVTTHKTKIDEKTYDAVERGLYEHCSKKNVIDSGTVV